MPLSSRAVAIAAGAAAAVVAIPASAQEAGAGFSAFVEIPGVRERSGQLLVRPVQWHAVGMSPAQAGKNEASAAAALNGRLIRTLPVTGIHVVSLLPGQTEEQACDELMATGLFEYAEPDWIVYPLQSEPETTPDDPVLRSQWQIEKIRAKRAWTSHTGDGSIVCAFVDTGVDVTHPDLAPLLVPGFNAVSNLAQGAGGLITDVNGHGTSVSGAAVAMGNNFSGGSGICWTARIMPIRATNYASGSAFMSNILYGASWAAFNGAKIVSVSYAGVENSSVEPTGQAIRNYGGNLVWAAGNNTANLSGFDHPTTTVVGATDFNDHLAHDTNYGRAVDLMAPGVNVYVPSLGGGYVSRNGTSFSAPITAGVMALAWSAAPHLSPAQVMEAVYAGCDPLEPVHPLNNTGWGRVNAMRAVQVATGVLAPREPLELSAITLGVPALPGLEVRYYSAVGLTALPKFGGVPLAQTILPAINFPATAPGMPSPFVGCPLASGFGVSIRGLVEVPTTGIYTFTLTSRDGARVYIDDVPIANNDGIHASRFRSGSVRLERGLHRLQCDYFSTTSQPQLILSIRGEHLGNLVIPASMYFHTPVTADPSAIN